MCTIVVAWQCFDDVPLVLAANRDEAIDRPSDPPMRLQDSPELWGGRDQLAGGTWLAVEPRGRVCAVTNRHPGGRVPDRDTSRSSRGQIPAQLLSFLDDDASVAAMKRFDPSTFNPVNTLYLSTSTAFWVGLDDENGQQSQHLTPGVHVLTEQNPDDTDSAKTAGLRVAAHRLAGPAATPTALVSALRGLVSSHERMGEGPQSAACIHADSVPGGRFGTVSSATVVISRDRVSYQHAEGYPCRTPYLPVLG